MGQTEILSTAVLSDAVAAPRSLGSGERMIAGYELQDCIGAGGYGEVWRAIGPGGFPKAVKILFGKIDGPQAETELKSLNLMRELRHPFLLNVERVELIDGRLIVVTELADCSLDRRFNDIVNAGGRGIPRDDLIGYLRDAADALDFMSEHHGLQHLDIKPENLLLQGTHAKVGDFGLTKSVAVSRASLVSGFTPMYAPPELFEGHASNNSDQYSLAIVYQVMLTGVPPFNGRTAAQLTAQHLHSNPDLSALGNGDRSVVARALSKNPKSRFNGCRQFIDELARRRTSIGIAARGINSPIHEAGADLTKVVEPGVVGKPPSTPVRPAQPLPPVNLTSVDNRCRPTLFIGCGGLGNEILSCLHDKLQQSYRDATLPAMAFLALDTDREMIRQLKEIAAQPGHLFLQPLAIPLQSPQQYRKTAGTHLNWLSRRWLFNIPRSGNVEGMRPLGRLAYTDHQTAINAKITDILQRILSEESIQLTRQQTGLEYDTESFDVCLVGSTAGGTSSGMMLDVAFQLRRLLRSNGICQPVRISAMLLHGTSTGGRQTDAQDANSVCFLKELQHYGLAGAQLPNDIRCPGRTSQRPFDDAWFVHLGDDLTSADYLRHTERLSEFLRLWSTSPHRQVLEAWHQEDDTDGGNQLAEMKIRTLGYDVVDVESWHDARNESVNLAVETIRRWLLPLPTSGVDEHGKSILTAIAEDSAEELEQLFESLSLSNSKIVEFIPSLLRGEIGKRIETYASDIWRRVQQDPAVLNDLGNMANTLASLVSEDASSGSQAADSVARITQTIRQSLISRLQMSYKKINQHITGLLDAPFRLDRAGYALAACQSRVDAAIAACSSQKADVQQTFTELCNSFINSQENSAGAVSQMVPRNFCQQYCMLMTCQTVCQCVISHLTTLREHLEKQNENVLVAVRDQLQTISGSLSVNSVMNSAVSGELVQAFEVYLQHSGQFRLCALAKGELNASQASASLVADATGFMMKQLSRPVDQNVSGTTSARAASGTSFPAAARPTLSNVGGGQRVLAVVPTGIAPDSWNTRLAAEFGNCVQTVQDERTDVSAFCEVGGIVIPAIVDALTYFRPRVIEMAERLHSRKDIAW